MIDSLVTLALLIGLELVLGVDNILVISILVSRLAENKRERARLIGLAAALIGRLLVLLLILTLASMQARLIFNLTPRDLILLAGGLFLLWKAVTEIHHAVELREETSVREGPSALGKAVFQIVLMDIVFSIDSVVTAVGLTNHVWVIMSAVILSFVAILFVSKPVGNFIIGHPALKILALSFLVTIGVTLFMEGMHKHVPKAYIYLPMGFALFVELLQMRYERNVRRK
jgi:predicted tellurium resistance membrane protein TerC